MEFSPIAHIQTDFKEKFGIPRQSGLAPSLTARIVFLPQYRCDDALRGLEEFSHLWLLWVFSEVGAGEWSPTVRPPRLGGNARMGVFATRSPYRPNPIGLSVVKLERIEYDTCEGAVIVVSGADIMDGTPILDIKPYIPYADSKPDALGGFAVSTAQVLEVECPKELLELIPSDKRQGLLEVLAGDPRPQYHHDPERIYTMSFADFEVSFKTDGKRLVVTACSRS